MKWAVLFLLHAWAANEPQNLLRYHPNEVLRNEAIEFHPVENHHFSIEAPQSCGSGSLNEKNPRAIKCQFLKAGATEATLNICDDKKTFCKPVKVEIKVGEQSSADAELLRKNENKNQELKKTLIPGFEEASPEDVRAKAAERKEPVLVMVSTDWCPPCNESKEYLIPSAAFQTVTKDWYKIYVDGDSVAAAHWEKTVPYRYFPSYVLLNSRMEEIGRFNGELRQGEFSDWAKTNLKWLNDPIAKVKTRVLAREAGEWKRRALDLIRGVTAADKKADESRLLNWALDQEEKGILAVLADENRFPELAPQILQYKLNELGRLEKEQKKEFKADKTALYKKLLENTFTGEHWAAHLQEFCEAGKDACQPYVNRIPERLSFLEKRPGLLENERESALADELVYITLIYQNLGDKKALKDYAGRCASTFEKMRKSSRLKISRAGGQGMLSCFDLAGNFAEEEKALKPLLEAYPLEPTFMLRKARMLKKQNKFSEALDWIAKAEAVAYGYNWFGLQMTKAEVLLSQKKKAEAKRVLDEALAQIRLDASTEGRNQRLVARLRGLQEAASDLKEN